jgi:hypothetical protein
MRIPVLTTSRAPATHVLAISRTQHRDSRRQRCGREDGGRYLRLASRASRRRTIVVYVDIQPRGAVGCAIMPRYRDVNSGAVQDTGAGGTSGEARGCEMGVGEICARIGEAMSGWEEGARGSVGG